MMIIMLMIILKIKNIMFYIFIFDCYIALGR